MDREAWLAQIVEPVLEPERPVVDPHHHLWLQGREPYPLARLHADTGSGHNVTATVFVECGAEFLSDGPEHLRCVGETAFVAREAEASQRSGQAKIAGIVGAADLLLGARVAETLEAHVAAGGGLFRGVRHAAAWDASPDIRRSHHRPPPHMLLDPVFREGFAQLARFGLSFDAWLFHPQLPELADLARAFPETPIVVDHFGGPLGVGPYASDRAGVFAAWRAGMAQLAACSNVFVKLGGMAMPLNGYGWHERASPASSDEFVAAQGDYYHAAIAQFGPSRAMFESNFPVDRQSLSYRTLWNAFKKIATRYTDAEKDELFRGAATRFYRLTPAAGQE